LALPEIFKILKYIFKIYYHNCSKFRKEFFIGVI
jgi:hypothetical protein